MKKKLLIIMLALIMAIVSAFALTACGETDKPDDGNGDNGNSTVVTPGGDTDNNGGTTDNNGGGTTEPEEPSTAVLKFNLLDEDTYEVIGYEGTPTKIVIPSEYNGKKVTSIGERAFDGCVSLTSITVPDSVTSIGYMAFCDCWHLAEVYNLSLLNIMKGSYDNGYVGYYALDIYTNKDAPSKLTRKNDFVVRSDGNAKTLIGYFGGKTEITIPNGVTSIKKYAFLNCNSLTSITMPNSVENIEDYAFWGCISLTSITIPDSVTIIGDSAFSGCSSLTSITIPSSVTNIGDSAFSGCSSLTSITIPDSVTNIGDSAFSGCSSLTSITIPDSVTSIGDSFNGCPIETATIPAIACKSVNNEKLKTVVITSGDSIVDCAFQFCSSLTNITIPNSIISVGNYAFEQCGNLKYNEYDNAYYLGNADNPYLVLVKAKSKDITSCDINENTKVIYWCAFNGCSWVTDITIPNSVTSIGDNAFSDCSKLTSITIPNSVTSIGDRAFSGCSGLTSITIPDSVTSIGECACEYCNSLKYNEYDNAYYLGNTNNPYVVLVKTKSTDITSCNINENTKCIYFSAFSGCSKLTNITIPNSVTDIGSSAFSGCSSLTSITIPNRVTNVGCYVFYNCSGLKNINCEAKSQPSGWYGNWNYG